MITQRTIGLKRCQYKCQVDIHIRFVLHLYTKQDQAILKQFLINAKLPSTCIDYIHSVPHTLTERNLKLCNVLGHSVGYRPIHHVCYDIYKFHNRVRVASRDAHNHVELYWNLHNQTLSM